MTDFLNTTPDTPTLIEVGQKRQYTSGAFSKPCTIKEVHGLHVTIELDGVEFKHQPTFLIGAEIK